MDNDDPVANLILDFLIRQPVDYRKLSSLLRSLPPPNNDLDFKKLLLLKRLEFDHSQRSLSLTTLTVLEHLEENEFRQGNAAVSDKMKSAYCAVAVDCTLKHLVNGGDEGKMKFCGLVRRLWKGKIALMEGLEKGGFGSEQLWMWKAELEAAAVEQDGDCVSVLEKFEGVDAEEAVRVYLEEERERMGPSFIELLVKRVLEREKMGPSFLQLVGGRRVKRDVAFELMAFLSDIGRTK